jgi:hypothetical protein
MIPQRRESGPVPIFMGIIALFRSVNAQQLRERLTVLR